MPDFDFELDPDLERLLAKDPDRAFFRAICSELHRAEDLMRTHLSETYHSYVQGGRPRPVRIRSLGDPAGEEFVDNVFELGGMVGEPPAVAMLAFAREWNPQEKERMAGYARSIYIHYAVRDVFPEIIPMIVTCGVSPEMEENG